MFICKILRAAHGLRGDSTSRLPLNPVHITGNRASGPVAVVCARPYNTPSTTFHGPTIHSRTRPGSGAGLMCSGHQDAAAVRLPHQLRTGISLLAPVSRFLRHGGEKKALEPA